MYKDGSQTVQGSQCEICTHSSPVNSSGLHKDPSSGEYIIPGDLSDSYIEISSPTHNYPFYSPDSGGAAQHMCGVTHT